jgi:hypothetical protein
VDESVLARPPVDVPACGPSDGRVDPAALAAAIVAGAAAAGVPVGRVEAARTRGAAVVGDQVVRVASRAHESLEVVVAFNVACVGAGVPTGRLLASGTCDGGWWALLDRVDGCDPARAVPQVQADLAGALGRLHGWVPSSAWWRLTGRHRMDSPGNVTLMFAALVSADPRAGARAMGAYADAVAGRPVVALHSDVGSAHNVLVGPDGRLAGVIDPGAHPAGPAEHDLAYAAVRDVATGGDPDVLLAAYPHPFDTGLVDELGWCLGARVLCGLERSGEHDRARRLSRWLLRL